MVIVFSCFNRHAVKVSHQCREAWWPVQDMMRLSAQLMQVRTCSCMYWNCYCNFLYINSMIGLVSKCIFAVPQKYSNGFQ